jgi:hypothetical protein
MSTSVYCETADGLRAFGTPSSTEPLRTPDGRLIEQDGPLNNTPEEYRARILQSFITAPIPNPAFVARLGEEVGSGFAKIIGDNALTAKRPHGNSSRLRKIRAEVPLRNRAIPPGPRQKNRRRQPEKTNSRNNNLRPAIQVNPWPKMVWDTRTPGHVCPGASEHLKPANNAQRENVLTTSKHFYATQYATQGVKTS